MSKLGKLKPERVFYHFEELSKIPRESHNELEVAKYVEQFGIDLGLKVSRDDFHNVIIEKPATSGMEDRPHTILQGHLDMVCVKEEGHEFDFETMPIPLKIDGDWVKAEGTTLGADNGIAVAMMMAILESKSLPHPPIIALFTATEETGMDGVMGLEKGVVKGDILINIDSEEEGVILASCAGGVDHHTFLPIHRQPLDGKPYSLTVSGLKGGHSGLEIDRNRANAIKLAGRLLQRLISEFGVRLISIDGGEKMNAIASKSVMEIMVPNCCHEKISEAILEMGNIFSNEYSISDPNIKIELEPIVGELDFPPITEEDTAKVAQLIVVTPFAVQTMSQGIEGLVETSLNLGQIFIQNPDVPEPRSVSKISGESLVLSSSIRSSVKSRKDGMIIRLDLIAKLVGASTTTSASYPEWQYKSDSPIREHMKKIWENMYGKELKVDAIHAGLECGFLVEKLGDIDMVSMGPNLYDVHTPKERMSISSVERVYDFLLKVLAEL